VYEIKTTKQNQKRPETIGIINQMIDYDYCFKLNFFFIIAKTKNALTNEGDVMCINIIIFC
jgi:hypothetical protein